MSVQIFINFTQNPIRNYVGWTPSRCAIRTTDRIARRVLLKNGDRTRGGQLSFLLTAGGDPADEIEIDLPPENQIVEFFVSGKFDLNTGQGFPSIDDRDASIAVIEKSSGASLLLERLMVRIRKNANSLTEGERDRFLSALVTLNQRGEFVDFQNMHTTDTSREIHGRSCFLPWHRLLLLDLERKLQAIDQSVTLPYWRFDQPAPNVFTRDFIGVPDPTTGLVEFSPTNPLINWRVTVFGEGSGRVRRAFQTRPDGSVWDPTREAALIENDETATINMGTVGTVTNFENFERMEGDPHGSAHVSFLGQISDIGRAPADPLFFWR
jgi:tyrosinase